MIQGRLNYAEGIDVRAGSCILLACLVASTSARGEDEAEGKSRRLKTAPTLLALLSGVDPEKKDDDKEEPINTDRPDFVEGSKNVPQGRLQIESGYTYSRDRQEGATVRTHSFPELLVRYGIFEWLELRVGQNWVNEQGGGPNFTPTRGAEDLSLGLGINLTTQKSWIPESRILLFTTVPTGSSSTTAGEVLPGITYCYGWELGGPWALGASTSIYRDHDEPGHFFTTISQACTLGYRWTEKASTFVETYGLFPSGAVSTGPQYYFDTGASYKIIPNFQIDIRGGVGLNRQAQDYYVGTGFSVRF